MALFGYCYQATKCPAVYHVLLCLMMCTHCLCVLILDCIVSSERLSIAVPWLRCARNLTLAPTYSMPPHAEINNIIEQNKGMSYANFFHKIKH